jgi:hypothetical protein
MDQADIEKIELYLSQLKSMVFNKLSESNVEEHLLVEKKAIEIQINTNVREGLFLQKHYIEICKQIQDSNKQSHDLL